MNPDGPHIAALIKYDLYPYYTVVKGSLRFDGGVQLDTCSFHTPASVIRILPGYQYDAEKHRLTTLKEAYNTRHEELKRQLLAEFDVDTAARK